MKAQSDPFASFRGRLLGLAYRMLGSRADADDIFQDAYLRIHGTANIVNPEAFLVTTVTRLCLDRLKSAHAKRAVYVGQWLPEPVLDSEALSPHTAAELADDLSFALLLVLERLSPSERAAFLLHDIFELSFAEIAAVLSKSESACRQLASRGRKAVRAGRSLANAPVDQQATLLAAFGAAVSTGDIAALVELLRDDAILLADGGGVKLTALNPILGADRIARFLTGVSRKFGGQMGEFRSEPRMVNGALGIVSYIGEELEQVLSIMADGNRIAAIYVVRNPVKLEHILR